jgi:glycosyltransferase involved in cell wall biosynthesis
MNYNVSDFYGENADQVAEEMKSRYPIESITDEYKSVFLKKDPLVSVVMTTYNRGDTLVNYALKSVLEQTYKNLQIIITADGSNDNTDELMSKVKDSRIVYNNLPEHTIYPGITSTDIWCVAGVVPHNYGMRLCEGDFITLLDHDDYFLPERIEKLVQFIQEKKCDVVHHPFHIGTKDHHPTTNGSMNYICGYLTTSAIFFHKWFGQVPGDIYAWKKGEPGDWNKFRKFRDIGAKIERYPDPLIYKEQLRLS